MRVSMCCVVNSHTFGTAPSSPDGGSGESQLTSFFGPRAGLGGWFVARALEGPFSAVSKPTSATKDLICRIFQDLQDFHTSAPLQLVIPILAMLETQHL